VTLIRDGSAASFGRVGFSNEPASLFFCCNYISPLVAEIIGTLMIAGLNLSATGSYQHEESLVWWEV